MYERKIPKDLDCGINLTMKNIGGKWKACIFDAIDKGVKRPTDLHKTLRPASLRVINMQSSELQIQGMLTKTVYEEVPIRVEYNLTPLGESLLPLIAGLDKWGTMHRDQVPFPTSRFDTDSEIALMQREN